MSFYHIINIVNVAKTTHTYTLTFVENSLRNCYLISAILVMSKEKLFRYHHRALRSFVKKQSEFKYIWNVEWNTHAKIARIEIYIDNATVWFNSNNGNATKETSQANCFKRPCSAECFHSMMGMDAENWSETVLMLFCSHLIFPVFLTSFRPFHSFVIHQCVWESVRSGRYDSIYDDTPFLYMNCCACKCLRSEQNSHAHIQKNGEQKSNSEFAIFTLTEPYRSGNSLMLAAAQQVEKP